MRRFFTHIEIKLMCLLLASGLWLYVGHLRNIAEAPLVEPASTLHLIGVPVRLKGSDAAGFRVDPPSVEITVQWQPENRLEYSSLEHIYAVIPVDGVDDEGFYLLHYEDIELPPGWILLEVTPKSLRLIPRVEDAKGAP